MRTFKYDTPVTSAAHMLDAVEFMNEHRFRVIRIEDPERVRFAMRGRPDPTNKDRTIYIGPTIQDMRSYYDHAQTAEAPSSSIGAPGPA